MSRNIWHYGAPLLDQSGSAQWSTSWSPGLSILLAPLGALPMATEHRRRTCRSALTGVVFLVLGYVWMRRQLGLSPTLGRARDGLRRCELCARASRRTGDVGCSRGGSARRWRDPPPLPSGSRAGLALLVVAAVLRPVNVAALAAALAWLLLVHRKRRLSRAAAITASSAQWRCLRSCSPRAASAATYSQFAHPAGSGGIREDPHRPVEGAELVPPRLVSGRRTRGIGRRHASLLEADLGRPSLAGNCGRCATAAVAGGDDRRRHRCSAARLQDDRRRRSPVSHSALTVLYRGDLRRVPSLSPRPWAGRSAWPLSPRSRAVAGGIHYYASVTPSKAEVRCRGRGEEGRLSLGEGARSPALGSGGRERRPVIPLQRSPHRHGDSTLRRRVDTFVVRAPPGLVRSSGHILDGFRGHEVYRRGEVSVVQVDARTAPRRVTGLSSGDPSLQRNAHRA